MSKVWIHDSSQCLPCVDVDVEAQRGDMLCLGGPASQWQGQEAFLTFAIQRPGCPCAHGPVPTRVGKKTNEYQQVNMIACISFLGLP